MRAPIIFTTIIASLLPLFVVGQSGPPYSWFDLVLYDEFEGTSLNTDIWGYGDMRGYVLGYGCGEGAVEARSFMPNYATDAVEVSDGTLKLHCTYNSSNYTYTGTPVAPCDGSWTNADEYPYRSGGIWSLEKFEEGMFEIRFKIEDVEAMYPSFWLNGAANNHPLDGCSESPSVEAYKNPYEEIDIFEIWADQGGDAILSAHAHHCGSGPHTCTILCPDDEETLPAACNFDDVFDLNGSCVSGVYKPLTTTDNETLPNGEGSWEHYDDDPEEEGFFTITMVWLDDGFPTGVRQLWYLNGEPWEAKGVSMQREMHLMLGTMVWEHPSYSPNPSDYSESDPASWEIDYVKIWKIKDCEHDLQVCDYDYLWWYQDANGSWITPWHDHYYYRDNIEIGGPPASNCNSGETNGSFFDLNASDEIWLRPGFYADGSGSNADRSSTFFHAKIISGCSTDGYTKREPEDWINEAVEHIEVNRPKDSESSILEPEYLGAHPNPAKDYLAISYNTHSKGTIIVTNIMGQVLNKVSVEASSGVQDLDIAHYPVGSYLVTLTNQDGATRTLKFVKE